MDGLDVSISGGDALGRVVDALQEVGESLPGDIFSAIENETRRLMDVARTMVRSMSMTHSGHHTGLRNTVAEGVGMEVDTGTGNSVGATTVLVDTHNIRVTTSMPNSNEASIPAGLDAGEWYHPLFGNRDHWYTESGSYSWFTQTFNDGRTSYERDIYGVLDAARQKIVDAAK